MNTAGPGVKALFWVVGNPLAAGAIVLGVLVLILVGVRD